MLRNSRCVNKYPKKVLKCISKLDKELQYAVIDGLEKGGDYLVKAINNLDDDAAELFVKTASKQSDEFFVLMSKYDDIPSWACSDVIDFNSAENVNEILKQNGYTNPPYKPGTNVRVYTENITSAKGQWVMNYEEIQGLSSKQIKDKFALPYEPTHICDVELPAGTEVRFGIANEVPEWGLGGGLQFDLMGQYFNSFGNFRPL